MPEGYFEIHLINLCQKWYAEDPGTRDGFLRRIEALNLTSDEEKILVCILPPNPSDFDSSLKTYELWIKMMRAPAAENVFWTSIKETAALKPDKQTLQSDKFWFSLLSSLCLWRSSEDYRLVALEFLTKITRFAGGDLMFGNLDAPWDSYYLRATLLLAEKYYAHLPEEFQFILLAGNLLILFLSMNLDLEKALGGAVAFYSTLSDRDELSVQLAACIYSNNTPVGADDQDRPVAIAYWIDKFRVLSNSKFDGMSLINLMKDDNIWKNYDPDSKALIRLLLLAYSSLITLKYVYQDVDLEKLERLERKKKEALPPVLPREQPENKKQEKKDYAEIKKTIINSFPVGSDNQFADINGVLVRLRDLSKQYNDPAISDLYYYDETDQQFKWKV